MLPARWRTPRLRSIIGLAVGAVAAVTLAPMSASAAGTVVFDGSPGFSQPSPSTLGGYEMTDFPVDLSPNQQEDVFSRQSSIPGPAGGEVTLSSPVRHYLSDMIWGGWGGTSGEDFYYSDDPGTITLTLPAGVNAFSFYATAGDCGEFAVTATTGGGTTSGPQPTQTCYGSIGNGNTEPHYFGFYTTDGSDVGTVTLSNNSGIQTFFGEMTWHRGSVAAPDTDPPAFSGVPDQQVLEAAGQDGTAYNFTAPVATDDFDGNRLVSCSPGTGQMLPLGTTTITCGASDTSGNTNTATWRVTVRDTTGPQISGALTRADLSATSPAGAVLTYTTPTAEDLVDGVTAVTCSPVSGSTFPIGTTSVSCSSTDKVGNTARQNFIVEVADRTAPVLIVPAHVTVDIIRNRGTVSWVTSANDLVEGNRPVSCSHQSGTFYDAGDTEVTCTTSDSRGNRTSATFTVTVNSAVEQSNDLVAVVTTASGSGGKASPSSLVVHAQGVRTALLAAIQAATLAEVEAIRTEAAEGNLQALQNATDAQAKTGQIPVSVAATIKKAATKVQSTIVASKTPKKR